MKNKYILGLNVYHADSAACLMKNGEIIFAIEEERLNRVKHWAGFPVESIKFCLEKANIKNINEIDEVSIGMKWMLRGKERLKRRWILKVY